MGKFLPTTFYEDTVLMGNAARQADALNLTNHFLIAMPYMQEDVFAQSVIYICEHNEQGVLGLVLNKPIVDITLAELFEKVELTLADGTLHATPVYHGGPVQPERGFVLHKTMHTAEVGVGALPSPLTPYSATLHVSPELGMSSSKDVLEAIAAGQGPQQFLIALGYAGWGAGQLEEELAQNNWLTVQATPEIIFDVPAKDRYTQALKLLGVQVEALVGVAGHA